MNSSNMLLRAAVFFLALLAMIDHGRAGTCPACALKPADYGVVDWKAIKIPCGEYSSAVYNANLTSKIRSKHNTGVDARRGPSATPHLVLQGLHLRHHEAGHGRHAAQQHHLQEPTC
jgi:hypothetical protein